MATKNICTIDIALDFGKAVLGVWKVLFWDACLQCAGRFVTFAGESVGGEYVAYVALAVEGALRVDAHLCAQVQNRIALVHICV